MYRIVDSVYPVNPVKSFCFAHTIYYKSNDRIMILSFNDSVIFSSIELDFEL